MNERALVLFNVLNSDGDITKTQWIEEIQHQNSKFNWNGGSRENPFGRDRSPITWEFIDCVLTIVDRYGNDRFATDFYTPMVRARGAVVAYHRKEGSKVIHYCDGRHIIQRQGRKPGQKPKC